MLQFTKSCVLVSGIKICIYTCRGVPTSTVHNSKISSSGGGGDCDDDDDRRDDVRRERDDVRR